MKTTICVMAMAILVLVTSCNLGTAPAVETVTDSTAVCADSCAAACSTVQSTDSVSEVTPVATVTVK